MRTDRAIVVFAFAGLCLLAVSASAVEAPAVARKIPADAVFALMLDHPGQALARMGTVVDRFKTVHPDMDWQKLGAKVKKEMGEDLLSAQGQRAFGIDPAGTIAVYASGFNGDPNVVLPLADAELFLQKMFAVAEKNGTKVDRKPKKRAGARVFKIDNDEFALNKKWCLIFPNKGSRADKGDPVKAFFGRGKKLAAQKGFKKTLAGLPAAPDGIAYLGMDPLHKIYRAGVDDQIKGYARDLKNADPKRRKWMQTSLDGMKKVRQDFSGLIAKFEGLGGSFSVAEQSVKGAIFLAGRPAGNKVLRGVFPGSSGVPGFHEGLSRRSVASGWGAIAALPLVDIMGALPVSPYRNMQQELDQAGQGFAKTFQMDLRQDLLGNLRDPVAAYFLTPDLSKFNNTLPMEQQVISLFHFVSVSRIKDPAKMEMFFSKLDALAQESGKKVEQVQVAGVKVRQIRPKPWIVLSWAVHGDSLLFGFGEHAIAQALKGWAEQPWSAAQQKSGRGWAELDFAAVGETISSAVAKGIGGESGMSFRMAWPMVQQILARFGKLKSEGQLLKGGALLTTEIGLH